MKKKYYILIGLITCMFMFLPVSSIKAGNNTILCHYHNEGYRYDNDVIIDYNPKTKKYSVKYTEKYESGDYSDHIEETFDMSSDFVYMSPSANKSLFEKGICPKRAFIDYDNSNEVCFDDTGSYGSDGHCPKKSTSKEWNGDASFGFVEGILLTQDSFEVQLEVVSVAMRRSLLEYYKLYSLSFASSVNHSRGLSVDIGRKMCLDWSNKEETDIPKYGEFVSSELADQYNSLLTDFPPLSSNQDRVNKIKKKIEDMDKFDTLEIEEQKELIEFLMELENTTEIAIRSYISAPKDFVTECEKYIDELKDDDKLTEEEAEEMKQNVSEDSAVNWDEVDKIINDLLSQNPDSYAPNSHCGGIFGDKTFGIIQDLFGIIKMIIPAIVILLGMADFLKVVFSGEEKDMKLAGMRLVKRIIIGIILILLPVLLGFIFDLVGFSQGCLAELL